MNVSKVFFLDLENIAQNQLHHVHLNPLMPPHLCIFSPFFADFSSLITLTAPSHPRSQQYDLQEHTRVISSMGRAFDNVKLFRLELWPDFVKSHMVLRQTEEQRAQPRSARSVTKQSCELNEKRRD